MSEKINDEINTIFSTVLPVSFGSSIFEINFLKARSGQELWARPTLYIKYVYVLSYIALESEL